MQTTNQQHAEDRSAGLGLGLKRPAFGLSREKAFRLELVLAMRGGGVLNIFEELSEEVTAERLAQYAEDIAAQIKSGGTRTFSDAWTATGQRAWVNLGEVTAFTVRQAK
jgi:hypothetical protein